MFWWGCLLPSWPHRRSGEPVPLLGLKPEQWDTAYGGHISHFPKGQERTQLRYATRAESHFCIYFRTNTQEAVPVHCSSQPAAPLLVPQCISGSAPATGRLRFYQNLVKVTKTSVIQVLCTIHMQKTTSQVDIWPVCAHAIRSLLDLMMGIAYFWTGVGRV